MLYPIVGYVTRDGSGVSWAHITYIDRHGDLQDLVLRKGSSTWSYGANITALANASVKAANSMDTGVTGGNTGWSNVPTAKGSLGVSVIPGNASGSTAQILIYYGADNSIHAIFPVGQGFYWPGAAGGPDPGNDPPDGPDDDDAGFPGPDIPGGGDPEIPPSPASWADAVVASDSAAPVTVYTNPLLGVTTVVYPGAAPLMAIKSTGPYPWGPAVTNISELSGNYDGPLKPSGFFWSSTLSEHIFGVSGENAAGTPGGQSISEFWAQAGADQTNWSAHNVLTRVTVRDPLPAGSDTSGPIAPNALSNSPVAAFVDASGALEYFAYINADGSRIHLCSHGVTGTWSIADISIAAIAPAPRSVPGLLEYPVSKPAVLLGWSSDRVHVVYTTSDGSNMTEIWSGPHGSWYWGEPNAQPNSKGSQGSDYGLNLATGITSFVWQDEGVDVLAYINQNGDIVTLTLKHGSAAQTTVPSSGLPWTFTNVSEQVKSTAGYVRPTTG
jgi:hypothetical protein